MIRHMHCFPFEKQVKIVVPSMTLHNFIRTHFTTDFEFKPYDDNDDLLPSSDDRNELSNTEDSETFCHKRDKRSK